MPYIIWDINPLPQYKGDKRLGNVTYTEPLDSARDFTSENATYNVQGTSSSVYPVKNIRIKFKQNKDYPQSVFSWTDNNGDTIKKFEITKDGIKDNYFTFKVDYASSEGANNVELVRLYNDAAKANNILTPPQKLDSKVRVGIDGYPVVSFHKDEDGNISFNSKANFNNDKANEDVYGFTGDWSEDGSFWDGDESWEITNNTSDLAKFKVPVTVDNFDAAFEIRFPDEDGYNKMDKLGPMSTWVASTYRGNATNNKLESPVTFTYSTTVRSEDGSYSTTTKSETFDADTERYRLIKFKAELKDWFDVNSTIFYYIFTHLYLMIDSRAKNAFPTYFKSRVAGDGGDRWFWLPYDMDTAIGIDNKGKLSFDYNLEDTDKLDGADVFNGQDSVIWNNLRDAFDGEIGEMYSKLRTQNYISYDTTENYFETHQGKWSENIFNEDSKIKYITPLKSGDNYLEMLQGSKTEQRKWWLYNRFKYMDSKYTAGDAKADFIQFRAYVEAGKEKPSITITPYADIYATVSYANGAAGTKQKRATRNTPIIIENPFTKEEAETDQETYIYSASQLKSIGDISGFKPDTVKVGNAIKLQELKVGSAEEGYTNPHLTELTLGSNTLLKLLDVRNCTNLTQAIDVSKCTNIEKIYFEGTRITGINLPDGGILKSLHLPATLTKLTLKNQPLLTDLVLEGTENIESLWLENIPASSIDSYKMITAMKDKSAVRLLGINETYTSAQQIRAFYTRLNTMKGLDAEGQTIEKAQVQGKIYINEISYADYTELSSMYDEVQIIPTKIICTVNFFNEGVLYRSYNILQGTAISIAVPNPTKESSESTVYTFTKWDKWTAGDTIITDLDVYAVYAESVRQYTVTFDTQWEKARAIPSERIVDWNTLTQPADIDKDTGYDEVEFKGWYTSRQGDDLFNFEQTVIKKDIILYAQWKDTAAPTVEINRINFCNFDGIGKDNLGIVAYQLVENSPAEPTEWLPVEPPVVAFTKNVSIYRAGDYYFWANDAQGAAPQKAKISARNISYSLGTGVTNISLVENALAVKDFALDGTTVTISARVDPHYKDLLIKINGSELTSDTYLINGENIAIEASCTPRSYSVTFDNMGRGTKPVDQEIVYLHKVAEPGSQYESGYIIEGWYKDQQLTTKWDFTVDSITENITLYANWVEYHEPTSLTLQLSQGEQVITLRFNQDIENGTRIDWGDGSGEELSPTLAAELTHTYTVEAESQNITIKLTSITGQYRLGKDEQNQVISPISTVVNVEFAADVPYTLKYAFKNAVNLEEINLTPYMTKVSQGAFQGCTKITTLNIPNSLIELEDLSFADCTNLAGDLVFSKNLLTFGTYLFRNTKVTSADFSNCDKLTCINTGDFQYCKSFTSVKFPPNLLQIGHSAFEVTALEEVILPSTLECLGSWYGSVLTGYVFAGCNNLKHVVINSKLTQVGALSFSNCKQLTSAGPIGGDYSIEFAWDTAIPDSAFQGGSGVYTYLEKVALPNTLTSIGKYAFSQAKLKSITLPPYLVYLGAQAFSYNSSLTSINIPSSVTYIGYGAFTFTGLTSIAINTPYVEAEKTTENEDYISKPWFWQCPKGSPNTVIHIPSCLMGQTPEETIAKVREAYGYYWNYRTVEDTLDFEGDL